MRFLKNVVSQLHTFILWGLFSAVLWSWIFTFVTGVPDAQRVTVYIDAPIVRDLDMSVALEEDMPEGLRQIRVRSFDYVMMDNSAFERGDIYIVPASEVPDMGDLVDPGAGETVFDGSTGEGAAASFVEYAGRDYLLFLGTGSVHLEDGLARAVADLILALE